MSEKVQQNQYRNFTATDNLSNTLGNKHFQDVVHENQIFPSNPISDIQFPFSFPSSPTCSILPPFTVTHKYFNIYYMLDIPGLFYNI